MENNIEVFVPGRLCLLGEHSDWTADYRNLNNIEKGCAIVAGLNLGIFLEASKSESFSYEYNEKRITLSIDELLNRKDKDFFEYVVSSARLMHIKYNVCGAKIICDKMTLPMNKGLASSAAICVAVVRIYNLLYNLNLSVEAEMALAYEAEKLTGSMCGRMDQICAYGQGLRKITFDSNGIDISSLTINKELQYVLVDLQGEKNTKKILFDLNSEYKYELKTEDKRLINALGGFNACCVEAALKHLSNADLVEFGKVLNEYQNNFDKNIACFSNELQAPNLHKLMDYCNSVEGILACKGLGSQGDGMAQILLSPDCDANEILESIKNTFGMECYSLSINQGCLNAIIPIAGKGTRMYPYSTIIDKVMLPVIDSRKVYPALALIIRELYFSEMINSINLIINEKQYEMLDKLEALLKSEKIDVPLSYNLQIRSGFGGAIASSRLVNEPGFSLVCLGDYIYRGSFIGKCTSELVDFWKRNNKTVVGIKKIPVNEAMNYGIVYGSWVEDNVLHIEKIVEKPDEDYARENLMIDYDGEKEIFAFFGQYIVDNDILRRMSMSSNDKEIGFSKFLNEYALRQDMYAIVVNGESYDLGNPRDYYSSFIEYGKDNI